MKPEKKTKDQIQNALTYAIKGAVDFIESEIAPQQIQAQEYFNGETKVKSEANRSKVVATVCRDTIRAIKPGLMRLFLQSGQPVEFIPTSADKAEQAKQQTQYASYVFDKCNGFTVLHNAFHDALVKKVGIVKAFYDETPEVEFDEYSGITEAEAALVLAEPGVDVVEVSEEQSAQFAVGPDGVEVEVQPAILSMKVSRTSSYGETKILSVAPEDFFVDRQARSIHDCYVCGDTTKARVGDVVEMGFDFEEVLNLAGDDDSALDDEQQIARSGYDRDSEAGSIDPSMREISLTEAYMRMDIEGTGVPKWYKFICAGGDYTILDYEPCDYLPYAVFEVDPEPHSFFGRSLVDIIKNDQDASTSLIRGLLDNIAMLNNPALAVDSNRVNMKDVLNNELGAIRRVDGPPQGAIMEQTVGSAASTALPAVQYYMDTIRQKTGVIGAGMGLDAEALQSQTAAGVRLADQTSSAVPELIARTLAEGGLTQLFRIIAQIGRQHKDPQHMQVDGQFVDVDPRSWTARLDMRVNVGLGTNSREERMATLGQILQWQQGVWQAYGPGNGLVTMTGIRAAMADMAKIGGIHAIDKYIEPMDPQKEQMLLMQAAQAAQGQQQGSDPNAAFVQVEQMKVMQRAESDQMEAVRKAEKDRQDAQIKVAQMQRQDDLARDKMAQDLFIKTAEMAAKPVPVNRIIAEQGKPRV